MRTKAKGAYPTEARMGTNEQVELALQKGKFDFVDFGCSDGKSIKIARELFHARKGLGIDVDAKKVDAARTAGLDVYEADITKLNRFSGKVRFVIMNHFLEHLNNVRDAKTCIDSACHLAREFVFIKQPYFEGDPYLFSQRLQFYWSHWGGHLNHMTSLDFFQVLQPMVGNRIERFGIYGVRRVRDSSDTAIHSVRSPSDQHAWNSHRHPPKPEVIFDRDVFYEIAALLALREHGKGFDNLERSFHWDKKIYDSNELENIHEQLLGLPYKWQPEQQSLQLSGHIAGAEAVGAENSGSTNTGMKFTSTGCDPIILLPERNLGTSGKLLVLIDLTVPCASEAQLFYQTKRERSYSEKKSLKHPVKQGRNLIRFELNVPDVRGRLRFDPGRDPGEYVLHQLKVDAA